MKQIIMAIITMIMAGIGGHEMGVRINNFYLGLVLSGIWGLVIGVVGNMVMSRI